LDFFVDYLNISNYPASTHNCHEGNPWIKAKIGDPANDCSVTTSSVMLKDNQPWLNGETVNPLFMRAKMFQSGLTGLYVPQHISRHWQEYAGNPAFTVMRDVPADAASVKTSGM
jgi:hypothetical protein